MAKFVAADYLISEAHVNLPKFFIPYCKHHSCYRKANKNASTGYEIIFLGMDLGRIRLVFYYISTKRESSIVQRLSSMANSGKECVCSCLMA